MNLAELVDVVSYRTGGTKTNSRQIIKTALETILEEVKKGGRVSLVGFGSFFQVTRKARIGRNPQTGVSVTIASMRVPRFKAGKEFKEKVRRTK